MRIFTLVLSILMTTFALADSPAVPTPQAPAAPTSTALHTNGSLTPSHPSYTLHLNSNATTGFRWLIVAYPKDLLTLTKHQYVAPQTTLVGASGYEEWTFQATPFAFAAPRVIEIKMMYAQPWNISPQTLVQTFYLTAYPDAQ